MNGLHCGHPSDPLDAGCQRCPRIVLHRVIVQQVVLQVVDILQKRFVFLLEPPDICMHLIDDLSVGFACLRELLDLGDVGSVVRF